MRKSRHKSVHHTRRWRGANLALSAASVGLLTLSVIISPNLYTYGPGLIANAVVSVTASVPANPDNTLAEQLAAKERALNEREQAINTMNGLSVDDNYALYSLLMSVALFLMLLLNFYFDMRRGRRASTQVVTT